MTLADQFSLSAVEGGNTKKNSLQFPSKWLNIALFLKRYPVKQQTSKIKRALNYRKLMILSRYYRTNLHYLNEESQVLELCVAAKVPLNRSGGLKCTLILKLNKLINNDIFFTTCKTTNQGKVTKKNTVFISETQINWVKKKRC